MQQIIVKEIKGPLGKGEKKFYAVVDDKGAEFTTFDTAVSKITPGSKIEAEIKVEGKYVNISSWKVIEEAPLTNGKGQDRYKRDIDGIEFEYRLKAKLQEIDRKSIEAQTAYKSIMELATKHETSLISGRFADVFDMALDWAKSRLEVQEPLSIKEMLAHIPTLPEKPKLESIPPAPEGELPEFKDGTALVNYALKHGWKIAKIREVLGIEKPTDIKSIEAAKAVLFGK